MAHPPPVDHAQPGRWDRIVRKGAGSALVVGALSLLAVHWTFPALAFDVATLVLVVLACAPLLSVFIDRLRFGELEVVSRRAERALEKAESVQLAQAADRDAAIEQDRNQDLRIGRMVAAVGETSAPRGSYRSVSADRLVDLAREFDELREREASSPARMARQEEIVATMLGRCQQVDLYDAEKALGSDSPGLRLTGYAWLFARPDPRLFDALLRTLGDREASGFNQYWAIRALQAVTASLTEPLSAERVERMQRILRTLPGSSGRWREMDYLMRRIGDSTGSPL